MKRHEEPNATQKERNERKKKIEEERVSFVSEELHKHCCSMTIRQISQAAKTHFDRWGSIGSVHKLVKEHFHTARIKFLPLINQAHKLIRLNFARSILLNRVHPVYQHVLDLYWEESTLVVHVDEKWYQAFKASMRCLLLPDEQPPNIHLPSKTHIPQIMIFAAVCRPVVRGGVVFFDGRIYWKAMLHRTHYDRTSKYHKYGDRKYQLVNMNKQMFTHCLKKTIKRIMERNVREAGIKNIIIQADNAGGHGGSKQGGMSKVFEELSVFVEQQYRRDFPEINFYFVAQPPRSPEFNFLDLGAWRSIQCEVPPILNHVGFDLNTWLLDIKEQTKHAWDNWDSVTTMTHLNSTLRTVLNNVLIQEGGNQFVVVHQRDFNESAYQARVLLARTEQEYGSDDDEERQPIVWNDDDIVLPPSRSISPSSKSSTSSYEANKGNKNGKDSKEDDEDDDNNEDDDDDDDGRDGNEADEEGEEGDDPVPRQHRCQHRCQHHHHHHHRSHHHHRQHHRHHHHRHHHHHDRHHQSGETVEEPQHADDVLGTPTNLADESFVADESIVEQSMLEVSSSSPCHASLSQFVAQPPPKRVHRAPVLFSP